MSASAVLEGAPRSIGLSSYPPRVLSLVFAAMCLTLYTIEGGDETAFALAPRSRRTVLRYARPLGIMSRWLRIFSTTALLRIGRLW
jgi:hypothetical protein